MSIRKILSSSIILASLMGINYADAAHTNDVNKCAIVPQKRHLPYKRLNVASGTPNDAKHIITPKKNQRQKRKFNRQNHNSKKLK